MSLLTNFQTIQNKIGTANNWCKWILQHKSPYTKLQYIEATGTQYINVGLKPVSTTIAEVSFCNPSVHSWEQIFGTTTDYEFGFRQNGTTTNSYRFAVNGTGATVSVNASSTFVIGKLSGDGKYYINGTQQGTISKTAPGNNNLLLFKGNKEMGRLRIAYFKVWSGTTLVRDMIPVKDENNIVCMYDQLNRTYYYNAGTGSFTAGPEID